MDADDGMDPGDGGMDPGDGGMDTDAAWCNGALVPDSLELSGM
jgi:hypothetical protein